ncbi:MAG TPA: HAD family hydrolase [Bacteroidetes bacterium]|nr:HAD family hydrolase [Bacteroidota bacterium]
MNVWLQDLKVDASWTLFLDRDGVLNRRIVDDYVCNWAQWEWLPGTLEALANLSEIFGRMVLVTNQRGISRGLMSETDLNRIHSAMLADILAAGGRLDAIYYCPHGRDAGCDCRKPRPGMIRQARNQFPEIRPSRSIMVGDSPSDMELAIPEGIATVFIGALPDSLKGRVNASFPSLIEFSEAILPV